MVNARKNGFTIVELLIVVVVIAILAAITVVAYTGITKQAQTAAYVSAADHVEKVLRMAMAQNPELRTASSAPWTKAYCLGTIDDLPAEGDFLAGDCHLTYDDNGNVTERISISTALQNSLDSLSLSSGTGRLAASKISYNSSTIAVRGIFGFVNGNQASMQWIQPDRSSCGRGSEAIQQYIDALADFILIRDGHKTIEEVFGANSVYTLELINEQIPVYEQVVSSYREVGLCTIMISSL